MGSTATPNSDPFPHLPIPKQNARNAFPVSFPSISAASGLSMQLMYCTNPRFLEEFPIKTSTWLRQLQLIPSGYRIVLCMVRCPVWTTDSMAALGWWGFAISTGPTWIHLVRLATVRKLECWVARPPKLRTFEVLLRKVARLAGCPDLLFWSLCLNDLGVEPGPRVSKDNWRGQLTR